MPTANTNGLAQTAGALLDAREPTSLLIVDDDQTVTAAAARSMRSAGIPCFTAADGAQALQVLEEHAPAIGLVVSDYNMPGINGVALLTAVRITWPEIPRALLTGMVDLAAVAQAVNEGKIARLFLKPWQPGEFQRSVVQLLEESRLEREHRRVQSLLDRATAGVGQRGTVPMTHEAQARSAAIETLTQRELEVLRLLTLGLTNRQMGERLYLTAATIKVHVAHIAAKLGATDRTQAAVQAVALGLVDPSRA